jgi:hypothetical protein
MKLKDFLKTAGTRLLKEIPGVEVVLDVVEAATGKRPESTQSVSEMVESLPVELRAGILELHVQTVQEQGATVRAMLVAEANSTHTTRPKIAWWAFVTTALVTLVVAALWAYAVAIRDVQLVLAVTDGWPWVIALLGPFVAWLNAYFGVLKTEHQNRLDAITGGKTKPTGIAGIIEAVTKR